MAVKKKNIRWVYAFILLIALIILTDVFFIIHRKKQVPVNTVKSQAEDTR